MGYDAKKFHSMFVYVECSIVRKKHRKKFFLGGACTTQGNSGRWKPFSSVKRNSEQSSWAIFEPESNACN